MSALRVLLINRSGPPSVGGVQAFLDSFARYLLREGHDVALVATRTARTARADGLPYRVAYGPGWTQMWRLVRWASVVQFSTFEYRWWLLAMLLRRRTIYIYHSPSRLCPKGLAWNGHEQCCFATHWRQCPSCLHRDRSWPAAWGQWLSLPIKSWLIDRAAAIVNISQHNQRQYGIPRSVWLRRGIDLARFAPDGDRGDYALFVGRLVPEKGCDVSIRAIAECAARGRRIPLAIVGEGPQRQRLEALARELGLGEAVRFEGLVTGDALVRRMQQALVVVVPSQWPEAWGRVAVEAMACGTPVIAAATGGLQETAGVAGLTFPVGDHVALAEQLLRVAGDPLARETLRRDGLALAKQYPLERSLEAHLALCREVANGHSPGGR
jgi:glycosyltransferase involved in cell wall biosynthesis